MNKKAQYLIVGLYLILWCIMKMVTTGGNIFFQLLDIIAIFIAIGFVGGQLRPVDDKEDKDI